MRLALLLATLAFSIVALPSPSSWAYRDYFTPEQKALLDKIQTLRIEAIALTDKGAVARQAGRSQDRLVRAHGSGLVARQDPG